MTTEATAEQDLGKIDSVSKLLIVQQLERQSGRFAPLPHHNVGEAVRNFRKKDPFQDLVEEFRSPDAQNYYLTRPISRHTGRPDTSFRAQVYGAFFQETIKRMIDDYKWPETIIFAALKEFWKEKVYPGAKDAGFPISALASLKYQSVPDVASTDSQLQSDDITALWEITAAMFDDYVPHKIKRLQRHVGRAGVASDASFIFVGTQDTPKLPDAEILQVAQTVEYSLPVSPDNFRRDIQCPTLQRRGSHQRRQAQHPDNAPQNRVALLRMPFHSWEFRRALWSLPELRALLDTPAGRAEQPQGIFKALEYEDTLNRIYKAVKADRPKDVRMSGRGVYQARGKSRRR